MQQLARLSGTSVSHPDATLRDRDGSIITTTVVLLMIPDFAPHMVIPDPYKNLTPSTFDPARPSILPTRAKLRQTYTAAIAQPKIHLIFIERHDDDAYKCHFESHLNSAILTATELHLSGQASVQSITVTFSVDVGKNNAMGRLSLGDNLSDQVPDHLFKSCKAYVLSLSRWV